MIGLVLDLKFNPDTVVALITLGGVIFSGIVSIFAMHHARQGNKAVNGVRPGEPRMYDLAFDTHKRVLGLEAWKDGYAGGPLDTGGKVTDFVHDFTHVKNNCEQIMNELSSIKEDVRKYGCPVKLGEEDRCLTKKPNEDHHE